MLWLLRSSPLNVKSVFWSKYWVGTLPLLLVALPLIVGTNLILESSAFILWLSTLTMMGATFALSALALGLGAMFPNYETENAAEIPTSFGGLLFMMAAVGYLAIVVGLEAWPVYRFLTAGVDGVARSPVPLVLGLGGAAAVTVVMIWWPLREGLRRVQAVEI